MDGVSHEATKPNPTLKVVLLGDSGVGKTCMRSQFIHHMFTNAYKATIGGDYLTTSVTINGEGETNTKVNLQIWDTAGQERFNSISQAFYRGTDVAVLVYDITNYESVLSLRRWFKSFLQHCHVEKPAILIVGNKVDRSSDRNVDIEEIRELLVGGNQLREHMDFDTYVRDWNEDVKEVTAKQLRLVEEVFTRVAQLGIAAAAAAPKPTMVGFDSLDMRQDPPQSSCAC